MSWSPTSRQVIVAEQRHTLRESLRRETELRNLQKTHVLCPCGLWKKRNKRQWPPLVAFWEGKLHYFQLPTVGRRIRTIFSGDVWHVGMIVEVYQNGSYRIKYDDAECDGVRLSSTRYSKTWHFV